MTQVSTDMERQHLGGNSSEGWPGAKRPADEALGLSSSSSNPSDPQQDARGSSKRLFRAPHAFPPELLAIPQNSHNAFQLETFAALPTHLSAFGARATSYPLSSWLEPSASAGVFGGSFQPLGGDFTMLGMQELSLPPLQWTPDLDMNGQGNWAFPVPLDLSQQPEQPGAEFEFHGPHAESHLGDAACVDSVSPSVSINWSPGLDDNGTTPIRSPLEGFARPGEESEVGEEEEVEEEDTTPDIIFDTCFGLLLIEEFQLRDKFLKDKARREVSLECYGQLFIIRDLKSKEYAGLVGQECAQPLSRLVADRTVKLSASLKSPTVLEVLMYGCHSNADTIGNLLLEHDCFLQQPDSFDRSTTYFNPHCLVREGHDLVPMFEPLDPKEGVRTANLTAAKKSQVTELLDSASGPTVFRKAQVSEMLKTTLREHQLKALAMMAEKESGVLRDAEFPSVWVDETGVNSTRLRFLNTVTGARIHCRPRLCLGGLLADDMGLGKTLSTFALIAGSLARHESQGQTAARATLIVAPLSTLTGWQDQIETHFKKNSLRFIVYHGSQRQKNDAALLSSFDVVLTTYDTIRAEHVQAHASGEKGQGVIHSIIWHRVVLDEAHMIQNRSSKRAQAVFALQARHRWCLTGTPIQNRLEDLGSLVEFLRVDPFDNQGAFKRYFLDSIDQQDAKGWERLRALVRAISLRRTKAALEGELGLPPPEVVTCQVFLDEEERRAYRLVKRRFAMAIDLGGGQMTALQLILRLRQICNHGVDLLPANLREWLDQAAQFGAQAPLQPDICESCGRVAPGIDEAALAGLPCAHQICPTCRPETEREDPDGVLTLACPLCRMAMRSPRSGQDSPLSNNFPSYYRPSSKVRALLRNLDQDKAMATAAGLPPEKSVVFSAWTGMLDLIEKALAGENIEFQRLDGTKTFGQRRDALQKFRNNMSCNVLLASLGGAAVGLDLSVATRVHLVEPGWNPAIERQALDRVHRLGQTRPVKQIRYLVEGPDSVERYMLQRQEWKSALIEASVGGNSDPDREMIKDLLKDLRQVLGDYGDVS